MSDWNSNQYLKFAQERTQPSRDLVSRLAGLDPARILDLGCGPGNSTAVLREQFPDACILGVDASDAMLEKAKAEHPDLDFAKCVLPQEWDKVPGSFDLIFSNACIQWIPEQEALLQGAIEKLKAGGVLAVQVPYIQTAPFYKTLHTLVEEKWEKLSAIRNFYNWAPEGYFDFLACSGQMENITIWETTYLHVLSSHQGILDWYRGSGLRPYLDALTEPEQERFTAALLDRVRQTHPTQKNGQVILKMPRVFFTAIKKAD